MLTEFAEAPLDNLFSAPTWNHRILEDRLMKSRANERHWVWLIAGVIGGLSLAYLWPHEQLQAGATDRDAKFAICTVDTSPVSPDAVFVLDFNTGRIHGAMLNPQTQTFTNFWYANVASDFKVQKNGKFTIIPGRGFLNANAGNQGDGQSIATGVLYVGEVTSGVVGCYQFGFVNAQAPVPPRPLVPVDVFPFRESK
jgi:hypothetical protein